jgi:hypothetical protein
MLSKAIDCCISLKHNRSTSTEVRRQMEISYLDTYMNGVAKGDIMKLCSHTRCLLSELNAGGETTHDLTTNLKIAL